MIAISGSDAFLRIRAVREVISKQAGADWGIFEIDASEPGGVSPAFSHAALTGSKTLAVVQNPDKDLDTIGQHLQSGDDFILLLLHYEGDPKENSKFAKFLGTLGSDHHRFSTSSKVWEQEAAAEAFCIAEAKTYGFKLDKTLAQALVGYAGVSSGVLAFEILKIATLAQAEGSSEITSQTIKACRATVTEGGIQQALEALSSRNARLMSRALHRVSSSHKEPTILLCRAIESKVYSWLPIVKAREDGLTPKAAAEASGINVWFYTNKLYPQTTKWNTRDLLHLIRAMATSERCLMKGAQSPWSGLVARLLSFCSYTPKETQIELTEAPKNTSPFKSPILFETPFRYADATVLGRCQTFAQNEGRSEVWKERTRQDGGHDSGRGSAEGKYAEFAVATLLKEKYGLPFLEPDLRTTVTDPGYVRSYGPDLDYRVFNPDFPVIQVKAALSFPEAWTIQAGKQSDRLMQGLQEDQVPLGQVSLGECSWGCSYKAYTGKSSQPDIVALCHVPDDLSHVLVYGFVPWVWLVSQNLIQPPIKASRSGKRGIYLPNIKYRMGIGKSFIVPESPGNATPLEVLK